MTSVIHLNLPPHARVTGTLRSRATVQNLLEDMIQIEIGNVVIDVGWYPDWDPNGEYRLTVFRDSYDSPIEAQLRTRDVSEVEAGIYEMVDRYRPRFTVTDSGNTAVSAPVDVIDHSFESSTSHRTSYAEMIV